MIGYNEMELERALIALTAVAKAIEEMFHKTALVAASCHRIEYVFGPKALCFLFQLYAPKFFSIIDFIKKKYSVLKNGKSNLSSMKWKSL